MPQPLSIRNLLLSTHQGVLVFLQLLCKEKWSSSFLWHPLLSLYTPIIVDSTADLSSQEHRIYPRSSLNVFQCLGLCRVLEYILTHSFPIASVTNDHKSIHLKQHTFILFQFWQSRVKNKFHQAEINVLAGCTTSRNFRGKSIP